MNAFGLYTEWTADGRMVERPCYTCGHCSNVVVMNSERERPRLTCSACGRWLCERNELCQVRCTPLYALAADGVPANGPGRWSVLVPAIMQGVTTVEEGVRLGIIDPKDLQ